MTTLLGIVGSVLLALMALATLTAFVILAVQDRHSGRHR
jgi:hypothetical protein